MKYLYAIIAVVLILWVAGGAVTFLRVVVEAAQQSIEDKTTYVLVGLIPLIPSIIAFLLIRFSWNKIVNSGKDLKN